MDLVLILESTSHVENEYENYAQDLFNFWVWCIWFGFRYMTLLLETRLTFYCTIFPILTRPIFAPVVLIQALKLLWSLSAIFMLLIKYGMTLERTAMLIMWLPTKPRYIKNFFEIKLL